MGWKSAGGGGGGDADAIHDNVAAEISAVAAKAAPVGGDFLLIEDSAAADVKKSVTVAALEAVLSHDAIADVSTDDHHPQAHTAASHSDQGATGAELETLTDGSDADALHTHSADGIDTSAIHDDTAAEISAIAEKVAPIGADKLVIEDSAAGDAKKMVQITNLPGGADADAIHDNVAAEISAVAEKAAPIGADLLLIEDSAAANAKKRVQITNLPTGSDADAIHDNVGSEISAIAEKTAPVDADLLVIEDSAAANAKKRLQIGNLHAAAVPEWVRYLAARQDDETPHTDDDLFVTDSSGDYTTQTVSGTATWTIGRGVLSCIFKNQTSLDVSAFLKPITSASAPMTIEARAYLPSFAESAPRMGICFTDGTATGSKIVFIEQVTSSTLLAGGFVIRSGTLTSFNAASTVIHTAVSMYNPTVLRLMWKSANVWQASISLDSNAYWNRGIANHASTMTPTHIGFFVASQGIADDSPATWDYLRVYDADLSL